MNKKPFTFDDFIGPEISRKIAPNAKISNFAELKISVIDPRIRKEVEERLKNIKLNLNKLKQL